MSRPALRATLSALLLGWTMTTLQASGGFLPVVAEGPVLSENLPQVADALEERGVTAVYADYWVSYPLQFAGGNRFSVTPYANSHFPAIDARTAADASPGIVAVTAAGAKVVRDDLKAKGRTFREADVAGYTIFWDVTPPRRGAGG